MNVRNDNPEPSVPRWQVWLVAVLLAAAGWVAYSNSFSVPFIFDDDSSIRDNASIHSLGTAIFPNTTLKAGETAGGRPLLNLSLAVNYALGGLRPRGYHIFNLLIHIAAGLALFGLVRRTLALPSMRGIVSCGGVASTGSMDAGVTAEGGRAPLVLGAAIALIWTVHPLQTESVTYIVQRGEALVSLFYLLTLYCFVRGAESKIKSLPWFAVSTICCLLGMATKEVMVSAPLMVLLYDRTFVSGSFKAALAGRGRKIYYAALAATWILLAVCALTSGTRGGTAGIGINVSWWDYLLTQTRGIVVYLSLAIWPLKLIFDYGTDLARSIGDVWWQAFLVAGLAVVSVVAFCHRKKTAEECNTGVRAAGFLGIFFFAVLAPSSSVVPIITQTLAEHRMYLALAAVVCFLVILAWCVLGRARRVPAKKRLAIVCVAAVCVSVVLGTLTVRRNRDYASEQAIWRDTAEKNPRSFRALSNLSNTLIAERRLPEALAVAERALELKPDFAEAANNAGFALAKMDRHEEALVYYSRASHLKVAAPEILLENMAVSLFKTGHTDEALQSLEQALAYKPDFALAVSDLGNIYDALGRTEDAVRQYDRALALDPSCAEAWNNRGNIRAKQHRFDEALSDYINATHADHTLGPAQDNAARLLVAMKRTGESLPFFETAIKCNPDYAEAHAHYAGVLAQLSRYDEAVAQYEEALRAMQVQEQARQQSYAEIEQRARASQTALMKTARLPPTPEERQQAVREYANTRADVLLAYGDVLLRANRPDKAVQCYTEAVALAPGNAVAQCSAGNALLLLDRVAESIPYYERALTLTPTMIGARQNLAVALRDSARAQDSLAQFETVIRVNPGDPPVHHNYALALAQTGRLDEAIAQEEEALRLWPDFIEAREALKYLRQQADQQKQK